MSLQAMVWVIEHSESRLGPRHVLLSIANHADREGKNAFPSIRTLAHESRLSLREVQYAIPILIELGELAIQRGVGPAGTNSYSLPLMGVQSLHRGGVQTGVQNPTRNKEEQKQQSTNTPLTPLSGGNQEKLTARQLKHLNQTIRFHQSAHLDSFGYNRWQDGAPVTALPFDDCVRAACKELLIPLDQAWAALRAAGYGAELKKEPQRAMA